MNSEDSSFRMEICRLAFMNWRRNGSPAGHFLAYWQEAETQIATARQRLHNGLDTQGENRATGDSLNPDGDRARPVGDENLD
jgi:hypothetical protein